MNNLSNTFFKTKTGLIQHLDKFIDNPNNLISCNKTTYNFKQLLKYKIPINRSIYLKLPEKIKNRIIYIRGEITIPRYGDLLQKDYFHLVPLPAINLDEVYPRPIFTFNLQNINIDEVEATEPAEKIPN
jgi:hypothetical protein